MPEHQVYFCKMLIFFTNESNSAVTTLVFLSRREQSLDKKYPGLFKHHSSRQSSSSNSMDKLIKKRNVPQKLPSGKRCDLPLVFIRLNSDTEMDKMNIH